jgi:hypothetical protein
MTTKEMTSLNPLDCYHNTAAENLVNHLKPFQTETEGKGKTVYYYLKLRSW